MSENTPDPAEVTEQSIEVDDPDAAALDDTGDGDAQAGEEVEDDDLDDEEDEDQAEEDAGA